MNIIELNPTEILIEDRARTYKELDDDFIKSIKEKGVIQPITVQEGLFTLTYKDTPTVETEGLQEGTITAYKYRVVAGERRLLACQQLGIKVPCIVRQVTDQLDYKEIELFENLHRKAMGWSDEARLIREIDELYKAKHAGERWPWSQGDTANLVGKSRPLISRKLEVAGIIDVIPELANCATEDEAIKTFKKLQNDVMVSKLREEQEVKIKESKLSRVEHAQNHYQIGDALEELTELAEYYKESGSTIALFEVDPPYGIDLQGVKKGDDKNREYYSSEYNEVEAEQYPEFLVRTAKLLYACAGIDCWVLFWHGWSWHIQTKLALLQAGFKVDDIPAIWTKGTGQTNNPALLLGRAHEPFFIARKGNPTIAKRGRSNVFNYSPVSPNQKYHPTERPIELMMDVLETFMYPGQTVCVPFLGSGVTLRAAYKLNMNGFGWDLNERNKDKFLLKVEDDFKHEKQVDIEEPLNADDK